MYLVIRFNGFLGGLYCKIALLTVWDFLRRTGSGLSETAGGGLTTKVGFMIGKKDLIDACRQLGSEAIAVAICTC